MEGKKRCKHVIVGHVPLTFHLFLNMEGRFLFELQGNTGTTDIGLEILPSYKFCHKEESEILKLKQLLNDKEDKGAS